MSKGENSAFPVSDVAVGSLQLSSRNQGMTLRDYFAAAALPALIEKNAGGQATPNPMNVIAELAYHYADAMVKMSERSK